MKNSSLVKRFLNHSGFAEGYVSAFSVFGNTPFSYRDTACGKEKDQDSLASDWQAVGKDISKAFDLITNEITTAK